MKKYAFAGASGRGLHMYGKPLASDYKDVAKLVGIYDPNYKRAQVFVDETKADFPVFKDFKEMIETAKPDTVIVTTQDAFHHEYTIKALKLGCDVIVEKPMTTDEYKCNDIIKTEKETGNNVTVTFNCRYMPFLVELKKLLMKNVVGDITSVHFEWLLDKSHGANYFRRWHSVKERSGGLQIHKATHHFDIINWLIDQEPRAISAFGSRQFYGSNGKPQGEFCFNCEHTDKCKFYVDKTKNEFIKKYYYDNMDIDNYCPNLCLFRDEINIEDTLSVNVKFSKGTSMSYSLTAYSPYEGYKININGKKGRLEIENYHGEHLDQPKKEVRLFNEKNEMKICNIEEGSGTHGGGDKLLRDVLFRNINEDPYDQKAGTRAGAMSAGIGIAINNSIKEEKQIKIKDLLWELEVD